MTSENAVHTLKDEVRELLTLLESCPTPDITQLRSRIEDTLDSAQRAFDRSSIRARIGRYATSVDDYVTGYPRLGFLTGIALGGALVYVATRFRSRA
jgi:ElaB/YqjD/DUF883 family membrane-anchored ribosome-binding protein